MVDTKITKMFVDYETGKDIYILSIKIEDDIHNIPVTKDNFEKLYYGIRSLFDNVNLD